MNWWSHTQAKTNDDNPSHWALFSDLISLTAIFSGIFYVGGYIYIKSYYKEFYLSLDAIEWTLTSCIINFIDQVILYDNWHLFSTIFTALFFAAFFYFSRRSKSTIIGYSLLCILVIVIFSVATNSASKTAKKSAARDWNSQHTKLPRILAKPSKPELLDADLSKALQKRSLRLLYESKNYLYLVRTETIKGSDLPVYVFPKSNLIMFEISRPSK